MEQHDFKELIESEIAKTQEKISVLTELTQPIAPDNAIGRVSRMDAINNKSVNESALRQAEEKLRGLHQVLAKADSPEFGICARCKNPIPLGRILIKPESSFCVRCAG